MCSVRKATRFELQDKFFNFPAAVISEFTEVWVTPNLYEIFRDSGKHAVHAALSCLTPYVAGVGSQVHAFQHDVLTRLD